MRTVARLAALLLLAFAAGAEAGAGALVVVHPAGESGDDPRLRYPLAVLELALKAAGQPARLEAFPAEATQERALRLVERGQMDVMWSMATDERMARLRAIPYPIDRGLLGWRRLLATPAAAEALAGVRDRAALARFTGVQGHDWPDLVIQRHNGLPVQAAASYPGLFAMLRRGRADHASRSLAEARRELGLREAEGLVLVPGLLLHYRTALVFYVNPGDEVLAEALERGLRQAMDDGRFETLFRQVYQEDLASVAAGPWRVLALENPLLAAGALSQDPRWWWQPEAGP